MDDSIAMHWSNALEQCIGAVLGTEMLNSALESLADAVHPDHYTLVGKAKDIAAGAVMHIAVITAIIGVMVFLPYIHL